MSGETGGLREKSQYLPIQSSLPKKTGNWRQNQMTVREIWGTTAETMKMIALRNVMQRGSVGKRLVSSPYFHSFVFFHQWLYSPLLGPGLFFSFVISFTQTTGLLGGVISPPQGRYLNTGQHKHRINADTDINASSGIGTHDPSVRASEDSSCRRPRGHCDRRPLHMEG
jgi:hypothetical protein